MNFARPVVRPAFVAGTALLGLGIVSGATGVALVASVLFIATMTNFCTASWWVSRISLDLVLPPSGIVGEQMNWSVLAQPVGRMPVFVGADSRQRVPVLDEPIALPVVLDRRGVYSIARLRVSSSGLLSLPLHAGQFVDVDLTMPICVAPKRREHRDVLDAVLTALAGGDGELDHRGRSLGDPHHLRAYQPGDAARLVHWPASARSGSLVVREPARIGGLTSITVVIDFLDGSKRGERMLSEAAWLCDQLVERGVTVAMFVTTDELARREMVTSIRQVDALLAEADPWFGLPPVIGPSPALRVVDGFWVLGPSDVAAAHPVALAGRDEADPTPQADEP